MAANYARSKNITRTQDYKKPAIYDETILSGGGQNSSIEM